jgi:hypothetical protein
MKVQVDRVLYRVDGDELTIHAAGHRTDVYDA